MTVRTAEIRTLASLDELVHLLTERSDLFLRWSKGPGLDDGTCSRDALSDAELPGLCANPLAVEPWWQDRSPRLWAARRVYDYLHLRDRNEEGVRAWVLSGREVGRGPDNEPLVDMEEAVAFLDDGVVDEATALVERVMAERHSSWGTLQREG